MNPIRSQTGDILIGLELLQASRFIIPVQFPEYTVFFIREGRGKFHADFGVFEFTAPMLLFATPLQMICLEDVSALRGTALQFHGDFYCIEYHRDEVSCNGLLFNNIYIDPVVPLTATEAQAFETLFSQLAEECEQPAPPEIVLRAYLQLFLAKSSTIKRKTMQQPVDPPEKDEQMERFRQLLDKHYLDLHKPSDYAALLAMSTDQLTRRCNRFFKKPASRLIQERLIIEAKKQLHLSRQSIKEIAWNLRFEDEFYFSRVFKKFTGLSPQAFREKTGISIVADLSRP